MVSVVTKRIHHCKSKALPRKNSVKSPGSKFKDFGAMFHARVGTLTHNTVQGVET
jgi:hypothetical protein